jgi:hypothetical protein
MSELWDGWTQNLWQKMNFKLLMSLLLYLDGSEWLDKVTELRICGIHIAIRLRYITEKHRRGKITGPEIIAKESV